ncbi:MAG: hypothetical protein J6Q69_00975, partial [Clostridia bacterium]|nr:hypothetical protein [Clostridia bacterium]
MTIEYLLSFIAAIILLVAYLIMVKNKEFWLTMLFFCVPIVNLGYTLMAGAKTLSFALFGNDVAYLGSVFLCMCMFLTIVKLCGFGVRRVHVISCIAAGLAMFFIVASTNVLHLYYESVTLTMVDGSAKLVKVYGPLHPLYVVYLVGYFVIMLATIIHSAVNRKIGKPKLAGFIAAVVCSNIVVWLIEKFISWNFEMLSVTYIISEVLLLLVWWM